ncbi:hypothetical protein Tco_1235273 [Tanacetum coccineum]
MADLKFVNQYNMVSCLEKIEENAEFHQILDFLSTCSINYALTAVVISESLVRSDLLFNDEDGIACLTNDEIFENLALMGYKQLSTKLTFQKEPQTESLQTETPPTVSHELQTEAHIEQILPSPSTYQRKKRKTQKHRRAKQVTALPQTSMPLDHGADEAIRRGVTIQAPRNYRGAFAQTRSERVLEKPNEPPLPKGHTSGSGEGSMEHTFELMDIVPPTPHDSPLTGGYTPRSDETVEILKLKQRVKKLERKRKSSISHPRRRIYRQVESFDDDLDEEDASKQGRESDKTKLIFQDSDC